MTLSRGLTQVSAHAEHMTATDSSLILLCVAEFRIIL